MKVKALKLFNDIEAKKLRKPNEIFEVSEKRASELNTSPHGVLIEVIDQGIQEEDKKPTRRKR